MHRNHLKHEGPEAGEHVEVLHGPIPVFSPLYNRLRDKSQVRQCLVSALAPGCSREGLEAARRIRSPKGDTAVAASSPLS